MDRLVHVACILGRGQYPRQILSGLARFARLGHPWVLDLVNKPDIPGTE